MKKIRKFMFLLCSLVLVIACTGVIYAGAAAQPTLNKTSRTIYVGGSSVNSSYSSGSYILKINNRPSKYVVTWSSSNASVATVSKYGTSKYKAIVTAVAAGSATITATVLDKSSSPSTIYTLTCKITVKKNCAAIIVSGVPTAALKSGETAQLSATMYNAAGAAAAAGELTDNLKWVSSNPDVATVDQNGLVTAAEGLKTAQSAEITCYTVQSSSGTYATQAKATASRTVTVTVEPAAVRCIASVAQKTLDSFTINFASAQTALTKDNIHVSLGNSELLIKSFALDASGTSATVTLYSDMAEGSTYSVSVSGTNATADTAASFIASKGTPVRMELYTDVNSNQAIAGQLTEIKFRLYNAQGVDITPVDSQSSEYLNYSNCITYTSTNVGVGLSGKSIYVMDAGQTVTVTASYKAWDSSILTTREYCNASITILSVTEASTVKYVSTMVTNSSESGSKLDWTSSAGKVANNDTGYKLVARVLDYSGNYIYSTDSSKIWFRADNNNTAFIGSTGTITTLVPGTDTVGIYYGSTGTTTGDVRIGTFTLTVGEARKASSILIKKDGEYVSSVTMSDWWGVSEETITVTVYDQYDQIVKAAVGSVTATLISNGSTSYGPYVSSTVINTDGSADLTFNAASYGETAGKTYAYKISYTDANGTVSNNITLIVFDPNTQLASSFSVGVSGSRDMGINSSTTALPSLAIKLYEMKGNVKYSVNSNIYPYSSANIEGYYYYKLYGPTNAEITTGLETGAINTVYANGTSLVKYAVGSYRLVVYKISSNVATQVAYTTFTLTDSNKPVAEQKATTTNRTINSASTADELKAIFGECFSVTVGTETIGTNSITLVNPVTTQGVVFFRSIQVIQNVTVSGQTYSLTTELTINKPISHVDG